MVLGDYLVESKCRNGHTSAAAFRGYRREQVAHVVALLSDRCAWRIASDGTECHSPCVHSIEHLGESDADEEAHRAFRIADTLPAMPAPELPWNGPRDSEHPGPLK